MKNICETCGIEFEHRKSKSYCSRPCEPKRNKKCESCGAAFIDVTRTNCKKYCESSDCNPSSRKSRDKECSHCERPFHDDSKQNSMVYCDSDCRSKASRERHKVLKRKEAKQNGEDPPIFLDEQEYECVHCRSKFQPHEVFQKYCSIECRKEAYLLPKYEDVPDHLSRYVTCLECDEEFLGCIPHGGTSNHFEEEHGMTNDEYKEKHGDDAPIYCEASIWKQHQKTWTATEAQRENYSDARAKYYAEDGVEVWNKGLTKEDHSGIATIAAKAKERLAIPENNPFFGCEHTEDNIEIMSQKSLKKWQDPEYVQKQVHNREYRYLEGHFVTVPHAVVIQALLDADLYKPFGFQYEYRMEFSTGNYGHHIDIASPSHKIAIEIDGCYFHKCAECYPLESYNSEKDLERAIKKSKSDARLTKAMQTKGWTVIRLWSHDLKENLPLCIQRIAEVLPISENIQSKIKPYNQTKTQFNAWVEELVSN